MPDLPDRRDRPQTRGEELANSVSHGVGFVAALVAAPFLVRGALQTSDAVTLASVAVFAAAVLLLYLASTV
jgi:hemolysin III